MLWVLAFLCLLVTGCSVLVFFFWERLPFKNKVEGESASSLDTSAPSANNRAVPEQLHLAVAKLKHSARAKVFLASVLEEQNLDYMTLLRRISARMQKLEKAYQKLELMYADNQELLQEWNRRIQNLTHELDLVLKAKRQEQFLELFFEFNRSVLILNEEFQHRLVNLKKRDDPWILDTLQSFAQSLGGQGRTS